MFSFENSEKFNITNRGLTYCLQRFFRLPFYLLVLVIFAFILSACATPKFDISVALPKATSVLTKTNDADHLQTALPVNIYQLTDASSFLNCNWSDLSRDDDDCLNGSLVAKKHALLLPSSKTILPWTWQKPSKVFAVLLLYRSGVRTVNQATSHNTKNMLWKVIPWWQRRIGAWVPWKVNVMLSKTKSRILLSV